MTSSIKLSGAIRALCIAALVAVVSACGHVTNQKLCADADKSCDFVPSAGYRFNPQHHQNHETLVILSISGGGVRASALAYGALTALKSLPGVNEGSESLLDDVDIISSVSGGSVTAAWYAIHGQDGLAKPSKLTDFLYEGGMSDIAWRGLNPVSLVRYAVTPYQRSDVLADFFADRLYGGTTYDVVKKKYQANLSKQPFVILNATDFGHQIGFPFTQNRFDLICSDLDKYRVADAVSASAGFPLVFSPVGLRNYSKECPVHTTEAWKKMGPSVWVQRYKQYDANEDDISGKMVRTFKTNQLMQVRVARNAADYLTPSSDDQYLHLLDGGLVDNLGINATLELDDINTSRTPGLYQRLKFSQQPNTNYPDYKHFKRVLYIVVNARSRSPSEINDTVAPPGLLTTLFRVADTPIDSAITGTQRFLTAELQATLSNLEPGPNFSSAEIEDQKQGIVTIDFEMIPNKQCRDAFWRLGTTWTLPEQVISDLITLPKILLSRSEELKAFYKSSGKESKLLDFLTKPTATEAGFVRSFEAVSKTCLMT